MNAFTLPSEQFLSLRLGASDSTLMQQLHQRMGVSKSEIVKRALRLLAASTEAQAGESLYDLGQPSFGRYADATRQSADIKSVVRQRMAAKRQASAL